MEVPQTPAPITPTDRSGSGKHQTRHRTRLRKACQRCRSRKQRCDGRRPACENCASANAECIPAAQEPMGFYPSRYVQSLEEHIANLERGAEDEARTAGSPLQQLVPTIASFSGDGFVQDLTMQPNAPAPIESNINDLYSILDEDLRGMPDYANASSNATDSTPAFMDLDVPVRSGAGYFQAYFELIHPRYPFLDVEECSKAYQQWKAGFVPSQNDIWSKFLVKMIFAIGCILQSSRLDQSAQGLHSDLITQAEASQSIMTNESNTPLLRLQAMLLYTIYALHGDSASRIVHITGVAMRFAVLHGFHQIQNGEAAQNTLNIKAFSCVYAIDRMVSIVLRLPIYPADEWITTPLYESQDDGQFYMPWALDAPGLFAGRLYTYNLRYFSHSCKIRQIQSDIISKAQLIDDQHLATYISHAEERINVWADMENISLCGYRSECKINRLLHG
ncbi:hypothetical protein BU24DRAFT_493228 [Aaosphaeria arxii CBS 175.79]|uniref:Zn(2)-C6 fungal-type domain-containing protein n=1 Tax=Aaosphaeria arxii CBS 175.79 TaxID=1450172 RepID=A0A6A5XN27_9PLEO|nr:uncharacterized protein BU24DRAFT_493228 [Aaosphaeria arxii CBS 175.79]KAF2014675.1 hypothetical protein BU24DRAFT_493228 [Aaosphaeria arxii CBS 175.79]